jgi:hypothetical protein
MKAATKFVVDRIEGSLAVLVHHEDDGVKFNLPIRYLPAGVREGDHLMVEFSTDDASRAAEQKRVADLLDDLTGRKN